MSASVETARSRIAEFEALAVEYAEPVKLAAQSGDVTLKGSQLSVLLDKIWAWLASVITDLPNLAPDGTKILLQFILDTVIPMLKELTPTSGDLLLDLLASIIKKYLEPAPPVV